VHAGRRPTLREKAGRERPVSQNSTANGLRPPVTKVVTRDRSYVEVDVDLGELSDRTTEAINGLSASGVQELRDP
jgi:hypothetical protein